MQPSLVAPVVSTSSTSIIRACAMLASRAGFAISALATDLRRCFDDRPRIDGVRRVRSNRSGQYSIPDSLASSCAINADWLKLRDQRRVQCRGTGVTTISRRSWGRCRTSCRATSLARPILPPYLRCSMICRDILSYATAARMPSCSGGLARQVAQYAPASCSWAKGSAQAAHQGGFMKRSFGQQSLQKLLPSAVIIPHAGQRSGSAKSSAGLTI